MGYGADDLIAKPVRSPQFARDIAINRILAKLRIPVEWSFGRVRALWAGVAAMRQVRSTPIAIWWHVAVLLTNCHTCLYGCAASDYFAMLPPEIEEYLQ